MRTKNQAIQFFTLINPHNLSFIEMSKLQQFVETPILQHFFINVSRDVVVLSASFFQFHLKSYGKFRRAKSDSRCHNFDQMTFLKKCSKFRLFTAHFKCHDISKKVISRYFSQLFIAKLKLLHFGLHQELDSRRVDLVWMGMMETFFLIGEGKKRLTEISY